MCWRRFETAKRSASNASDGHLMGVTQQQVRGRALEFAVRRLVDNVADSMR